MTGIAAPDGAVRSADDERSLITSQSTITSADYRQLGVVANTVGAVVNNGVIVSLTGRSVWTVTGTSHLSSLTVQSGSTLKGANGKAVTVTVDGVATTLVAGTTYTGDIRVSLG